MGPAVSANRLVGITATFGNCLGRNKGSHAEAAQFSSCRPRTLENSHVLLVTRTALTLSACAAIMVSREPIGSPPALQVRAQIAIHPHGRHIERENLQRGKKHFLRLAIAYRGAFGHTKRKFCGHHTRQPDVTQSVLMKTRQHFRRFGIDDVKQILVSSKIMR
ncbi:MAG: hypothetical protein CAPSK01_001994 [Candidatus Accumulibacter vicinus]|uniref:Uncharacterized protein n=1 Tax=Candidatus Accumulibacter vicinus TaxID=2954382 RepID=A0A084Y098_9PROT|nr:MAG: hypothetical protein CAPSK01_001994 [Candidatus Accumulibacter vicinus]